MQPDRDAPEVARAREAETARLLLAAARQLGETLEPRRVHERFRELLAEAVQHDGVVVSSYDAATGTIRCEFAWADGALLPPEIFPPLTFSPEGGGMQSAVIRTGEPLLANDVPERVSDSGTYYDVDRSGRMRKIPESGLPDVKAAMMIPVKHEGAVVGVVQVMSDVRTFSEDELELAEGLVGVMGAAVRNARLHEQRAQLEAAEAAALAVAAERENAARALEAVGDGVCAVGDDGTIRFWNRAAALLTETPAEDALGRPAAEILREWPSVEAQVPVAETGERPRSLTLPVEIGGRELWFSFVAVRIADGVVYAFRDSTLEHELEGAKSDFVATVSHELRTPMTAVLGAAKTLLREDLELSPEQARSLLEMIVAQATRLSAVIDDVLLASRIERGDLRLHPAAVDLTAVVDETLHALRAHASEASVVARLGAGATTVEGDRDRIQQVLMNLVENATKYAGGEIVVSSRRVEGAVRVEVADRGPGIPPAEQRSIFDKFYRGDTHVAHGPSGTGLGLYISRELVERMGGRIGVRSTPGRGSTFSFELPAADSA